MGWHIELQLKVSNHKFEAIPEQNCAIYLESLYLPEIRFKPESMRGMGPLKAKRQSWTTGGAR
jgi:hypothetical protein